jgi:hypothetical protein
MIAAVGDRGVCEDRPRVRLAAQAVRRPEKTGDSKPLHRHVLQARCCFSTNRGASAGVRRAPASDEEHPRAEAPPVLAFA